MYALWDFSCSFTMMSLGVAVLVGCLLAVVYAIEDIYTQHSRPGGKK